MNVYKRLTFELQYRCVACRQRHLSPLGAATCCLLIETIWHCRKCKSDLGSEAAAAAHKCEDERDGIDIISDNA